MSRDVKFMNESAFRHEYKEILDEEERANDSNVPVELNAPNASDEKCGKEETHEVPQHTNREDREKEAPTTKERSVSVPWHELVVPRGKRGRGRPRILRSGSVGRPRKVYSPAIEKINNSEHSGEDSKGEIRTPIESADDDVFTANYAAIEPSTWEEARRTSDTDAWRSAMEDEYLAQVKNGT